MDTLFDLSAFDTPQPARRDIPLTHEARRACDRIRRWMGANGPLPAIPACFDGISILAARPCGISSWNVLALSGDRVQVHQGVRFDDAGPVAIQTDIRRRSYVSTREDFEASTLACNRSIFAALGVESMRMCIRKSAEHGVVGHNASNNFLRWAEDFLSEEEFAPLLSDYCDAFSFEFVVEGATWSVVPNRFGTWQAATGERKEWLTPFFSDRDQDVSRDALAAQLQQSLVDAINPAPAAPVRQSTSTKKSKSKEVEPTPAQRLLTGIDAEWPLVGSYLRPSLIQSISNLLPRLRAGEFPADEIESLRAALRAEVCSVQASIRGVVRVDAQALAAARVWWEFDDHKAFVIEGVNCADVRAFFTDPSINIVECEGHLAALVRGSYGLESHGAVSSTGFRSSVRVAGSSPEEMSPEAMQATFKELLDTWAKDSVAYFKRLAASKAEFEKLPEDYRAIAAPTVQGVDDFNVWNHAVGNAKHLIEAEQDALSAIRVCTGSSDATDSDYVRFWRYLHTGYSNWGDLMPHHPQWTNWRGAFAERLRASLPPGVGVKIGNEVIVDAPAIAHIPAYFALVDLGAALTRIREHVQAGGSVESIRFDTKRSADTAMFLDDVDSDGGDAEETDEEDVFEGEDESDEDE